MKYIKLYEEHTQEFDFSSQAVRNLRTKYDYGWIRRVVHKILDRSIEKYNIDIALAEWTYFGNYKEDPEVNSVCDICGQTPLRYLFEIDNDLNRNTYWIGSECILKFSYEYSTSLKVRDENGNLITNPIDIMNLIRAHYNRLIKDSAVKYVLSKLEKLFNKIKDNYVNKLYLQYAELNYFKPNQMMWLDMRFRLNNITDLQKSKFKVNIANYYYLDDVLNMDDITFRNLIPYLSGNLQKGDRSRAILRRTEHLRKKHEFKDIEQLDPNDEIITKKIEMENKEDNTLS